MMRRALLYDEKISTNLISRSYADSHYDEIVTKLEAKLPGKGALHERYNKRGGIRSSFLMSV